MHSLSLLLQAPYLPYAPRRQLTLLSHVRHRQRPLGINFDANAKNNHYQNCGRATTAAYEGLRPLYSTYFGVGGQSAGAVASHLISSLSAMQGAARDGK